LWQAYCFSVVPAQKEVKKDPFFEKWKVLSQESRDASPTVKVRSIEIPPEPGMKKGDILPEEKVLPEDKVSLKMRDADVALFFARWHGRRGRIY